MRPTVVSVCGRRTQNTYIYIYIYVYNVNVNVQNTCVINATLVFNFSYFVATRGSLTCVNATLCADGEACVLNSDRCDGFMDCSDHSDEMNCTGEKPHSCLQKIVYIYLLILINTLIVSLSQGICLPTRFRICSGALTSRVL